MIQTENEIPRLGDYVLSATDVADILWLAAFINPLVQADNSDRLMGEELDDQDRFSAKIQDDFDNTDIPLDIERELNQNDQTNPLPKIDLFLDDDPDLVPVTSSQVYSQNYSDAKRGNDELGAIGLKVPQAPAILEKMAIIRSLRPFQRRISSTRTFALHEEETSERIATAVMGNQRSWIPVSYPALERWLDLVVMVDGSPSMMLWQQTVDELVSLLVNIGIFRNVQRWTLRVIEAEGAVNDESKTKLHLYPYSIFSEATQQAHLPTELLDPQQRRLFLVISDCSSIVWDSGAAQQLLQPLSQHNLVSIMQVLPEELWKTTTLGLAKEIRLISHQALSSNAQLLNSTERQYMARSEINNPIPVISLDPEAIALWARFIAGRERRSVAGYFLPTPKDIEIDIDQALIALGIQTQQVDQDPDINIDLVYDKFREHVPRQARPLAAYFAAAPLTLPVMRMIQTVMLPHSTHADFVRVFYSGLIQRTTAYTSDISENNMIYDFVGGDAMREFLLTRLPRYSTEQVVDLVINELSRFLQEHIDQIASFDAIIGVPDVQTFLQIDSTAQHFAEVTTKILRYLGGSYETLANNLEQILLPELPQPEKYEQIDSVQQRSEQGLFEDQNSTYNVQPLQIEWCWIDDGTFIMGSDFHDNEKPVHEVQVDGFWLARTQVTNAQYKLFIEAGGYSEAKWWTPTGWQIQQKYQWTEPRYWHNTKWNQVDHPVVGISWYEAMAFCRWAMVLIGEHIVLPTEAEWEKAARGTDGRTFPWGYDTPNQICNFDGIKGQTTPVSQYASLGESPYGTTDMAGNVAEWCLSKLMLYPYNLADGRNSLNGYEQRAVRGGSWMNSLDNIRCVNRGKQSPTARCMSIGFRCARKKNTMPPAPTMLYEFQSDYPSPK